MSQPHNSRSSVQSGNVGTLSDDAPVVYDPSSYFGHNEAECVPLSSPPAQMDARAKEAIMNNSLAIARIFGGFGPSFFTEYHSHRPKSEPVDEYEERMILYELFHYLNHTLMFGVSRQIVCSRGDGADAVSLSKVWICGAVEGTHEEASQVRGFERDLGSIGSSGDDGHALEGHWGMRNPLLSLLCVRLRVI